MGHDDDSGRTDFVSVPVDRSRALARRSTATPSGYPAAESRVAGVPSRRECQPVPARPDQHRAGVRRPAHRTDRPSRARRRRREAALEAKGSSSRATSSTRASATWRSSTIPTATSSCSTAGMRPVRAELLERYRALPLPTGREEHWRFTDLKAFDPDAWTADGDPTRGTRHDARHRRRRPCERR